MSHDGTLEVEWKGQAFPYLLHHPKDPRKTDSYGNHRSTLYASDAALIRSACMSPWLRAVLHAIVSLELEILDHSG